jgi:hypothetical protein
MAQRGSHRLQRSRQGRCPIMGHQSGDAAHQSATRSKKLR